MDTTPTEPVLKWVAEVVGDGSRIVAVRGLHGGSSPWLLRADYDGGTRDVLLRVADRGRIWPQAVATGAAALRVAEAHGLAAPRLLASDLDGQITGAATTLETALPGSSSSPSTVSAERLREAGAALARVHAVPLAPQRDLPLRTRPTDVDDLAMERRWATLYGATPDDGKPAVIDAFRELTGGSPDEARRVLRGHRSSPLLHFADERLRGVPVPRGEPVFVHGDIWAGNMLWRGDTSVALIDWKNAGVGDPGVDLGQLRLKMAVQYGPDAPAHVLGGWQRESGQQASNVAYWDAVAGVYSPTVLDDWEAGFDDHGHEIGPSVKTGRRDRFLRTALERLGS